MAKSRLGGHEPAVIREPPPPPSPVSFGLTFAVVALLIGLYLGWVGSAAAGALFAVALVFLALAGLAPHLLKPLNHVWFRFGMALHAIVSPLIFGLLYLFLFAPIGIILRLAGRDPLALRRTSLPPWVKRDAANDRPGEEAFRLQF